MSDDERPRSDLTKIREWFEADGPEPEGGWEWPSPPEYVEYRVEGQMRADVLARIGRDRDDLCEVRLIEGSIEGGYSEYTVEMDYSIEVWIHDGPQSQRVYDDETGEAGLGPFLRWLTDDVA